MKRLAALAVFLVAAPLLAQGDAAVAGPLWGPPSDRVERWSDAEVLKHAFSSAETGQRNYDRAIALCDAMLDHAAHRADVLLRRAEEAKKKADDAGEVAPDPEAVPDEEAKEDAEDDDLSLAEARDMLADMRRDLR